MSERIEKEEPMGSAQHPDDSGQPSEENGITQVDLQEYEFSPPGSMGWTAKEYEKLIDQLQKDKEGE
ncbi:MAG TPA: hypothetical protein VF199_08645 [Bacillales bacterium]